MRPEPQRLGKEITMKTRQLAMLVSACLSVGTVLAVPVSSPVANEGPLLIATYDAAVNATTVVVLKDGRPIAQLETPGQAVTDADGEPLVLTSVLGELRDMLESNVDSEVSQTAAWVASQMEMFATAPTSNIPKDAVSPVPVPRALAAQSCGDFVSLTGKCLGTCTPRTPCTGKCCNCMCSKSATAKSIEYVEDQASLKMPRPTNPEVTLVFTDNNQDGSHWITLFDSELIGTVETASAPLWNNNHTEVYLPLNAIAALREQAQIQSSPLARAFTKWAGARLGVYAKSAAGNIPGTASTGHPILDEWCGNFTKLNHTCADGCISSDGQPKCTGCVCHGISIRVLLAVW